MAQNKEIMNKLTNSELLYLCDEIIGREIEEVQIEGESEDIFSDSVKKSKKLSKKVSDNYKKLNELYLVIAHIRDIDHFIELSNSKELKIEKKHLERLEKGIEQILKSSTKILKEIEVVQKEFSGYRQERERYLLLSEKAKELAIKYLKENNEISAKEALKKKNDALKRVTHLEQLLEGEDESLNTVKQKMVPIIVKYVPTIRKNIEYEKYVKSNENEDLFLSDTLSTEDLNLSEEDYIIDDAILKELEKMEKNLEEEEELILDESNDSLEES